MRHAVRFLESMAAGNNSSGVRQGDDQKGRRFRRDCLFSHFGGLEQGWAKVMNVQGPRSCVVHAAPRNGNGMVFDSLVRSDPSSSATRGIGASDRMDSGRYNKMVMSLTDEQDERSRVPPLLNMGRFSKASTTKASNFGSNSQQTSRSRKSSEFALRPRNGATGRKERRIGRKVG